MYSKNVLFISILTFQLSICRGHKVLRNGKISNNIFEEVIHFGRNSSFFYNEEIFVQLDELDKMDRITYALIKFKYSLTEAQNILV